MIDRQLNESVSSTAQIVFFLIGAMTIVEVIDAHNGFEVITSLIRTRKQATLMWLVGFVTFFLSAILDNLTTTIVMISLMRKLLANQSDRLFFASMIVIAANAGGAWSAIGDVTTTMLWIGGQITPLAIIKGVFLASLINLVVPLFVVSYLLRGRDIVSPRDAQSELPRTSIFERNLIFYLGLGILVMVPAFKTATHLPPFMGILFGLGILWTVGELIHRDKEDDEKKHLTLVHALTRIDMSSIVFFIGILLAVAALEHARVLEMLAKWLDVERRASGRDRGFAWFAQRHRGQRSAGRRIDGHVQPDPISGRQFLVGICRLLRRHRRIDPDHWFGRRAWPRWVSKKFTSSGMFGVSAAWPCWAISAGSSPTSCSTGCFTDERSFIRRSAVRNSLSWIAAQQERRWLRRISARRVHA